MYREIHFDFIKAIKEIATMYNLSFNDALYYLNEITESIQVQGIETLETIEDSEDSEENDDTVIDSLYDEIVDDESINEQLEALNLNRSKYTTEEY